MLYVYIGESEGDVIGGLSEVAEVKGRELSRVEEGWALPLKTFLKIAYKLACYMYLGFSFMSFSCILYIYIISCSEIKLLNSRPYIKVSASFICLSMEILKVNFKCNIFNYSSF